MGRLVVVACAVLVFSAGGRAQPQTDLANILDGLAQSTRRYYERFISIICAETVHTQNLKLNLAPAGRPRITVYELSVTRHSTATSGIEFRAERTLQSVNGRPARTNERPECTDPKTGTPEPLAFLLAANQRRYRFSVADAATGPPGTRAIDFVETPVPRVKVNWEGNCFVADGGGQRGRVWFDPTTYDVVQVEAHLSEPFVVPLPPGRFGVRSGIRVEKSQLTVRFSRVDFQQPDERLMLPASIETLHVLRGVPSLRIHQMLGNYRRFLTRSEIRTGIF